MDGDDVMVIRGASTISSSFSFDILNELTTRFQVYSTLKPWRLLVTSGVETEWSNKSE